VRAILDTHSLLWFSLNDARLSDTARSCISDGGNEIFVSPATFWEIAIKIRLGKYKLQEDFTEFFSGEMRKNDFTFLPITLEHTAVVATLPFHHRDPFDRLLIAQAIVERIDIISADQAMDGYAVTRVW